MMIAELIFYMVLSLLFTHEVDAMKRSEWRLLYVLSKMEDSVASHWFIAIHVPLFWLLLWLTGHPSESVQLWFRIVFDIFVIVHAGLHWRLRFHPLYDFHEPISKWIINGAAVLGGVHLLLLLG